MTSKGKGLPKANIDPPKKALLPGGGWQFSLLVGKDPYPGSVHWTVDNPDVGRFVSPGEFQATDDYTYPKATITAASDDGKYTASAEIRIQVYRGLMEQGPFFVDDYFVPGIIGRTGPALMRPMPWNDWQGRRAAALILDALEQLPEEYLKAAGPIAIVRVNKIDMGGAPRGGMHLPFFERLILLSQAGIIGLLTNDADVTDADVYLVQSIVHEMAHSIMANRALPDGDRLLLVSALMIGVLAPTPAGWPPALGLIPATGFIYAKYFSPLREEDFCTQFAKVAGWVINNPNPLGMFFKANTATPNIVSGLIIFGKMVGLRNSHTFLPIPIDRSLTDDEIWQYRRDSGYPRPYAATDVHEDWACTMEAIGVAVRDPATNTWVADPILSNTNFAPKRDFALNAGIWPKGAPQVEPGGRLSRWARKAKKPLPDLRVWGVSFGLYAGKPTTPDPIPIDTTAMRSFAAAESAGAEAATEDDWMGEGEMQSYDDPAAESGFRLIGNLQKLAPFDQQFEEVAQPALEKAQAEVEDFAASIAGGATVEFLRTAECHGEGLLPLHLAGNQFPAGGIELPGVRAQTGDIVCSSYGALYLVVRVDDQGRILQVTGDMPIEGDDDPKAIGFAPGSLRYFWRPARAARQWIKPDASPGVYQDLNDAMLRLTGLWGESTGKTGADLSAPGSLVAEALEAAGMPVDDVAGFDDAALQQWLKRRGLRAAPADGWTGVAVGDVLRFRGKRWGICTRVNDQGAPIDAVAQGGQAGLVGEEPETAKMRHRFDPAEVTHAWRPARAASV